jgi:hypothetical protein
MDDFSNNTAKLTIGLSDYLRERGHYVEIGTLVNDLGMICGEGEASSCSIERNPNTNTQEQVDIFCFSYPEFSKNVATEKHMKNRGLRKIKKIFKQGLDENELLYSIENESGYKDWHHKSEVSNDILLFQEKGKNWIAKCPTIMGAYYASCIKRVDSLDRDIVIIDFCSFNDKDKVLKGAEVALQAFSLGEHLRSKTISICPVLINDDCSNNIVTHLSLEGLS